MSITKAGNPEDENWSKLVKTGQNWSKLVKTDHTSKKTGQNEASTEDHKVGQPGG